MKGVKDPFVGDAGEGWSQSLFMFCLSFDEFCSLVLLYIQSLKISSFHNFLLYKLKAYTIAVVFYRFGNPSC